MFLAPIVQEIFAVKVDDIVDLKIQKNEIAVKPFLGGYISGLARATLLKFDTRIEWSLSFPNLVSNYL